MGGRAVVCWRRHEAVACGKRGSHEVVVAFGDVENCAAPGDVQPLVTVAYEEVWVEFCQVDWNTSHAVSAINAAQNAMLTAEFREALKGHADTWLGNDCVVDCDTGVLAAGFDLFNGLFEFGTQLRVRQGICVLDHVRSRRCGLGDVRDSLATSAVYCLKVDDHIARLVDKVAEDGVGASGGIGDEHSALHWRIEEFCDGLARLVEHLGIVVSDEDIWSFF